jgi:hypothetical protein
MSVKRESGKWWGKNINQRFFNWENNDAAEKAFFTTTKTNIQIYLVSLELGHIYKLI